MKKSFLIAAFLWTFPCFGIVPPYLIKLEKDFWKERKLSSPVKKEANKVIKKIFDPREEIAEPESADLSSFKKWEIVKHLDHVQKKKHQARKKLPKLRGTPRKTYTTSYNREGTGDPCPEKIVYKGHNFQLSLNYNGAHITKQPGNFHFKELLRRGRFSAITYDSFQDNLEQPDVHLLLLAEISRRHAVDPLRSDDERLLYGLDEHHQLPVALGLAMADTLIRDRHIRLSDFWRNGETYHLYTGHVRDREDAFVALYGLYKETYMGDLPHRAERKEHLLSLMNQYFEVSEDEDLGLSKLFDETL